MKNDNFTFLDFIYTIIMILFGLFMGWILTDIYHSKDYKNGQIDALNGNIRYELVTHENKTATWEIIGLNNKDK